MRLFKLRIRQGRLAVMASGPAHADAQATELERDMQHFWVRSQVQVKPRLFALGAGAWEYVRREGLADG